MILKKSKIKVQKDYLFLSIHFKIRMLWFCHEIHVQYTWTTWYLEHKVYGIITTDVFETLYITVTDNWWAIKNESSAWLISSSQRDASKWLMWVYNWCQWWWQNQQHSRLWDGICSIFELLRVENRNIAWLVKILSNLLWFLSWETEI